MSISRCVFRTVLTLLTLLLLYQFFWGRSKPGITHGAVAPPFTLPKLTGGAMDLVAYRGQVVWITFWTTWCGACHQMLPSIDALHQIFSQRNVVVAGIDVEEDAATVAAYLTQHRLSLPVLLDTEGTIARLYGIPGYPVSILIDQQGRVVDTFVGIDRYDGRRYLDKIHTLLAQGE